MTALLIVDMQNDFMPGGPLAVPGGDEIISEIQLLVPKFSAVIATQDFHPADHLSFAANHLGKQIGDHVQLLGVDQLLWPIHCVQGTVGAELVDPLKGQKSIHVCQKGTDRELDSYSAFFDNAHRSHTGLEEYLKEKKIHTVVVVGVATEYCVLYSVLDALALGFLVEVKLSCCRGINAMDEAKALQLMKKKGAQVTVK